MDDTTSALKELMDCSQSLKFAVAAGFKPKRMYTTAETAEYLGVQTWTINKAVSEGTLKPFMPAGKGHGRRFDVLEVDRWIGTCGSTSPSPSDS